MRFQSFDLFPFTLDSPVIHCHSLVGFGGFSPFFLFCWTFLWWILSLWAMTILPHTSLPLSSLFFSLPTEVIIGMWVWRSQLIDNNVLVPDKRTCPECKNNFGELQAWLECFYHWTKLAFLSAHAKRLLILQFLSDLATYFAVHGTMFY